MCPFGRGFGAGKLSRTPDTPSPIDGLHVLVVDDEPEGREAMAYALEDYGARHGRRIGAGGAAGHRIGSAGRARQRPRDPERDSYALIRRVRALAPDRGGRLLAVALTAQCRAEDKVRALRAGFQLHLAKPVSPADVAAAVAALAGRKPPAASSGR
jgi:CheY-like chemotaxis protein